MAYSIRKYQTAHGTRYSVRYRTPDNRLAEKRGFTRKMDADEWGAENVTTALSHGSYIHPTDGRITVGELWPDWIAAKAVSSKTASTRTWQTAYHTHVEPIWGSRAVNGIQRGEVQRWVTDLAARRSASVTIRAANLLASLLDVAVADRRLASNPARGLELPRTRRRRHVYLTADELYRVAGEAKWRRPIVLTLGLCGMRWGELVGLHVRDVDLDARRITIHGSATQIGMSIVYDDTKTGEARRIMIPGVLAPVLRDQMEGRRPDDVLFSAPGKPLDAYMVASAGASNRRDGWFTSALRRAGVDRGHMTVHDLRHTAASLMVSAGANVKAVQRQLGHKSAAMTLDTYADLFDDDLDELSREMDVMLSDVHR